MTQADLLAPAYAQHANFQTQWGLASINADLAYGNVELLKGASAAPGAGVTIGFIDTGIDDQHPVFAGKTIYEQLLSGASYVFPEAFPYQEMPDGFEQIARLRWWDEELRFTVEAPGCDPIEMVCDELGCDVE